jgi:hypothetical protein
VPELLNRIRPSPPRSRPPVAPPTISVAALLRREGWIPPQPRHADPRWMPTAVVAGTLLAAGAVVGAAVLLDAPDDSSTALPEQPEIGPGPDEGLLSDGDRAAVVDAVAAAPGVLDAGSAPSEDWAGRAFPAPPTPASGTPSSTVGSGNRPAGGAAAAVPTSRNPASTGTADTARADSDEESDSDGRTTPSTSAGTDPDTETDSDTDSAQDRSGGGASSDGAGTADRDRLRDTLGRETDRPRARLTPGAGGLPDLLAPPTRQRDRSSPRLVEDVLDDVGADRLGAGSERTTTRFDVEAEPTAPVTSATAEPDESDFPNSDDDDSALTSTPRKSGTENGNAAAEKNREFEPESGHDPALSSLDSALVRSSSDTGPSDE